MSVKRELILSHNARRVPATLEWDATCAHAVTVTVGQDEPTFQFGMDREVLATCLNPRPDNPALKEAQEQVNSTIMAVTHGEKIQVIIKIVPPGEEQGRQVVLWGKSEAWREFMQETEEEVPLGSESSFAETDKHFFPGIDL